MNINGFKMNLLKKAILARGAGMLKRGCGTRFRRMVRLRHQACEPVHKRAADSLL